MSRTMDDPPAWVDDTISQILGGRRVPVRQVVRGAAAAARGGVAVVFVLILAVCVAAWFGWWRPGHGVQIATAVVAAGSLLVHRVAHIVLRRTGRDAR